MADYKDSFFFSAEFLNVLGSLSVPHINEDLMTGLNNMDFWKEKYGDYDLAVVPISSMLQENDFSSLLSAFSFDKGKAIDYQYIVESEAESKAVSPDSTKTEDINAINRAFRNKLSEETDMFVRELIRTDFEDGMDNYLAEEVREYIHDNALATYSWINHIYSDNQKNEDVIAGLLRIIAIDVEEEDYDDLLPIVKAGLCDYGAKVQEAAVMVIERWRTKNCLDALQTANIQSPWIRSYAKKVEIELIKELEHVIS